MRLSIPSAVRRPDLRSSISARPSTIAICFSSRSIGFAGSAPRGGGFMMPSRLVVPSARITTCSFGRSRTSLRTTTRRPRSANTSRSRWIARASNSAPRSNPPTSASPGWLTVSRIGGHSDTDASP
ncbi:MAG: hypothetical protein HY076_00770 [Candidatus Eisenbacteria bacterium]|uniref:Uncharacterized protein n=1 Tax=Eiseniibacteriota bacterium TaxID=2212470 RepID=A0A9D6QLK6_UNCEI|nr:hypothetical protein [Candidatus Eisenbacteria bacterium]